MSLFVLRLFRFHRDMAVSELITCRSSQASRHRRGSGCADGCRRTFHSIKRRRGEGAKKQLVSVRGSELLIDFHGSCFGLITQKATVRKKCNRKLERRHCQNQQRISPNPRANGEPISSNCRGGFFLLPIFFFLSLGQPAVNGVGASDSRPLPICYRGIFTGRERRRRDRTPTQSAEEPLPS